MHHKTTKQGPFIYDYTPTEVENQIEELISRFAELRNPSKNIVPFQEKGINPAQDKISACLKFIEDYSGHQAEDVHGFIKFFKFDYNEYINSTLPIYQEVNLVFQYRLTKLLEQLKPLRLIKLLNKFKVEIEETVNTIEEFNDRKAEKNPFSLCFDLENNYNYTACIYTVTNNLNSINKFNYMTELEHQFLKSCVLKNVQNHFNNNIHIEKFKQTAATLFMLKNRARNLFSNTPKPLIYKILDDYELGSATMNKDAKKSRNQHNKNNAGLKNKKCNIF